MFVCLFVTMSVSLFVGLWKMFELLSGCYGLL